MTDYIILRRNPVAVTRQTKEENITEFGDGRTWTVAGTQAAVSANAAIKASLNGAEEGGTFVAIPQRSWQPVSVSIEKSIKLG